MPTASTLGKLNVTVAEEEEEEAAYTQDITMKCHTMNNIYRVNLKLHLLNQRVLYFMQQSNELIRLLSVTTCRIAAGWRRSQLTCDERRHTPWTGRQIIKGLTYRDTPPLTLTYTGKLRVTSFP